MIEQQNISGQLTQSTPEEFEITGNVLTSYKGNAQEVTVPDGMAHFTGVQCRSFICRKV